MGTELALAPKAAAAALGISRASIYSLLKKGELPRRKVGRRTLIAISDLEKFLQRAVVTTSRQNEISSTTEENGESRDGH
jgi:excisionase family DNA binding protein